MYTSRASSTTGFDYDTSGVRRYRSRAGGSYGAYGARRSYGARYASARRRYKAAEEASASKALMEGAVVSSTLAKLARQYPESVAGLLRGPTGLSQFTSPTVEEKFKVEYGTLSTVQVTPGFLFNAVSALGPGSAYNQRIGQKVAITNLDIMIELSHTSNTGVGNVVRIAVVLDKQANGAVPPISDDDAGSDGIFLFENGESDVFNHETFNPASAYRFDVLADVFIPMDSQAVAVGVTTHRQKNISLSFKEPIVVMYKGSGADVTGVLTNNIVVIAGCKVAGTCNLAAQYSLRYTDI